MSGLARSRLHSDTRDGQPGQVWSEYAVRNLNKEFMNLLSELNALGLKVWTQGELGSSAVTSSDDKWFSIIGNALEAPVEQSGSSRIGRCHDIVEGQGDGDESDIVPSNISCKCTMQLDLARAWLLGNLGQKEDLGGCTFKVIVKDHGLQECELAEIKDQG